MSAPFAPWWEDLGAAIEIHRRDVDEAPIAPSSYTGSELQAFDFETPVEAKRLVTEVARLLAEGGLHNVSPRYFGLFVPDIHPIGVAADALVAAFNPQLAVWSHAPAANDIERHTLAYFQRLLGHNPAVSAAHFTTGGLEANHTAVIAAVTARLPRFSEDGLDGRRPVVYVSAEAHDSFVKVAHATGIGRSALRTIPVEADLRVSLPLLREAIGEDRAKGRLPTMIVGTAGTTSAGVVDPLQALAQIANDEGLWFHADAAWGGAALVSPKLRATLVGIEDADSVTLDAHKWLSVPMGAGMFFCRHREVLSEAFAVDTGYMPEKHAGVDNYVNSLQWSRRCIGLKVFMTLAELGEGGVAQVLEGQAELANQLRTCLTSSGWSILNVTPLPVVCFTHPNLRSPDDTVRLVNEVVADGGFWVSAVRLSTGATGIRACITNHRTTAQHVSDLVEELSKRVNDLVLHDLELLDTK